MTYRHAAVACPECGVELAQHDLRDKWRCRSCGGVLLGIAELEGALGEDNRQLVFVLAEVRRAGKRPCPTCREPMDPVRIELGHVGHGVETCVELERCVAHGLVWFDRGELGRVRDALATRAGDPNVSRIVDRLLA